MTRTAPTLTTERLILRGWRKDDFRPWHAIMREPAVHRFFGPEPIGQEECWRRMCASIGMWQAVGFGGFAVTDRGDGRLLGNVGLFNAWRDFEPQFGEQPEMGWIMASETHGTGKAREACDAVIGWAEADLAPTPLWAIISEGNEPSFRLAEGLGFKPLNSIDYHGPTRVLQRPAWSGPAA